MGTRKNALRPRAAALGLVAATTAGAQELTVTSAPTRERALAPDAVRVDLATGARTDWTPAGGASGPSWSPDGERLAYCGGVGLGFGLFVLDVERGETRRIAPGLTASSVSWSPDGEWLALTGLARGAEPGLFLVRPDGRDLRRLATGARPAWSPDGRRIAWYDTSSTPIRIEALDLDAERVTRLASFGPFPLPWAELRFSADAEHLYYTRTFVADDGGFSAHVHRVRMRDRVDEAVTSGAGARLLGMSPDGETLALLREGEAGGGTATLTLRDLSTGRDRPLLSGPGGPTGLSLLTGRTVASFAWSPDGALLAFDLADTDETAGRTGVLVADLERGLLAPVGGPGVVFGTSLAWRP